MRTWLDSVTIPAHSVDTRRQVFVGCGNYIVSMLEVFLQMRWDLGKQFKSYAFLLVYDTARFQTSSLASGYKLESILYVLNIRKKYQQIKYATVSLLLNA